MSQIRQIEQSRVMRIPTPVNPPDVFIIRPRQEHSFRKKAGEKAVMRRARIAYEMGQHIRRQTVNKACPLSLTEAAQSWCRFLKTYRSCYEELRCTDPQIKARWPLDDLIWIKGLCDLGEKAQDILMNLLNELLQLNPEQFKRPGFARHTQRELQKQLKQLDPEICQKELGNLRASLINTRPKKRKRKRRQVTASQGRKVEAASAVPSFDEEALARTRRHQREVFWLAQQTRPFIPGQEMRSQFRRFRN